MLLLLQLISPPRLRKGGKNRSSTCPWGKTRNLQCEQGGRHWSQLSGSQVIDCSIQLWYLAHLADSNYNLRSSAYGEHLSPSFCQLTQRCRKHILFVIVWGNHFSTMSLGDLSQPVIIMFWMWLQERVENTTGSKEQMHTLLWVRRCRHMGEPSMQLGIRGKKHSPELYRSWNLIKAYFGGLSKTQTSKRSLFFVAPLHPVCPSYIHCSI